MTLNLKCKCKLKKGHYGTDILYNRGRQPLARMPDLAHRALVYGTLSDSEEQRQKCAGKYTWVYSAEKSWHARLLIRGH